MSLLITNYEEKILLIIILQLLYYFINNLHYCCMFWDIYFAHNAIMTNITMIFLYLFNY